MDAVFKSFKDLQSYLIEKDMIDLEELTDTILQSTEAEAEAEAEAK